MSKKIMFVDDREDHLLSVKQLLLEADNGYEFIGVNSGEKCIQALEEGVEPDIILLDIMMPEMSGWLVFDTIRDNPKWSKIPIVFVTARSDKLAEETGRFLADDYIEKPIDAKIIERIEKVLK